MYQILDDFKALLLTVDANISHYFGLSDGEPWRPYTVWTEYELDGLYGGDTYAEPVWRVLVERYTKDISIHAPRGGSDELMRPKRRTDYLFQSTLPAGGATDSLGTMLPQLLISIHAPRGGSDPPTM